MVISAIPILSFAANPSLTLSASKTTDIKAGDKVTVTVTLKDNTGLGALTADLVYDASAFKATSISSAGLFALEEKNASYAAGKARFTGLASGEVTANGTVFTVEFEALKATDSEMKVIVVETCDKDYNEVTLTTGKVSFKGYVEPTTWEDPCMYGHDYSQELIVMKPTCKEVGIAQKTCKVCGDRVEYALEPTDMCEPGAWKVTKVATTTEEGEKVQECKYCGTVLQRAKIAKLPSDPIEEPSIPSVADDYNFFIQEPSRTTLRNKDGIILHINPNVTLPKGAYIEWQYKNSNFNVEEAGNGMKLMAVAEKKGWTVFTATLYDIDGNIIAKDSVELYSKSGLFDRVAGFFRSMFGATKIYEY